MKSNMDRNALCWITVYLIFSCLICSSTFAQGKPYVILISFDGFRWDYPHRGITPNLEKFKENGVTALSLEPVFPTKTFPNHLSIITGMYPENHGIIMNVFTNPFTGESYRLGDTTSVRESKWYWGEAFWETAERQGIICASYFWPGSELHLKHRSPTYRHLYDHHRPYEKRIEGVLNWLKLPSDKRPHFITLYFHETDSKGHDYGPDSEENNEAIKLLDSMLGLLLDGLEEIDMLSKTNIIIVSDHGMIEVSKKRAVMVDSLLSGFDCKFTENGALMTVKPKKNNIHRVYNRLKETAHHFRVFYTQNVPEHFHFSSHPFIAPIVLMADIGWSLVTKQTKEWLFNLPGNSGGNHGFDNHYLDMHGIFYAMGPSFKQGYQTGTLKCVDIYPLLCKIFGIQPRQNIDSKLDRISFILREN